MKTPGSSHYRASVLVTGMLLCAMGMAGDDHERARHLRETGDILPLETILTMVEYYHPGRILEVELENEGGWLVYEVEIVDPNGVVLELTLDPRTGELLSIDED